jgi:hypothetical protein
MQRPRIHLMALVAAATLLPAAAPAQSHHRPTLHVDTRWKECAFVLHASLTQAAWRQFTREAGIVTSFRPLTDAKPMGRGVWEVSALQWTTAIDDHDAAWNDTFVHPDSTHWLTDGSGLAFPGLTVRTGVNARTDVGVYFTQNPHANYGFYGAQVQYALFERPRAGWSAAARVSFVSMFGPADLDHRTYGADLVASRDYDLRRLTVSPYASVSGYLSTAHEKTAAVDLRDEAVLGGQATLGAVAAISIVRIAAEVSTARVNSRSLKVGFAF